MDTRNKVAIVVALVLLALTSIPVLLLVKEGVQVAHPQVNGVFIYPTIGACVGAVLVVMSYVFPKNESN